MNWKDEFNRTPGLIILAAITALVCWIPAICAFAFWMTL